MNFTDELLRVKVASHRRPFPLDAAMFLASASVAALPSLALWQTALVIAPALVFAGAAWWATQTHTAGRVARVSAALALALAALAAAALIGNSSVSGAGQAFGVRSDPVGAVVGLFVAFVGWVIVRYSEPYLDGERHEGSYVAWLLATAKSHWATSWQPAAVASPCTRAITGTGKFWMPSITRVHWANSFW